MFKKILAGLTAIALSLGMVVLTAAPASAHHGDLDAKFVCTSETAGTITWSVENWKGGKVARVMSSNKAGLPVGTLLQSGEKKSFTEAFSGTGDSTLSVTLAWYDGSGDPTDPENYDNSWSGSKKITIKSSDYNGCKPDDTTREITICHWDNGQGGKWTANPVSISSILNGQGHAGHSKDIIPSFNYVKNGVPGTYPGKNWTGPNQNIWNLGCDYVTPAAPTFDSAVCTAPGQYGLASYTIPSTTGVKYEVRFATSGGWTEKSADTYTLPANGYVEVRAVALSGYEIKNNPGPWKKQFSAPDCVTKVTPTSPTFESAQCDAAGEYGPASYTIPSTTGVKYEVRFATSGGWTEKSPNTYTLPANGYVEVRAVALAGYQLKNYSGPWKKQFVKEDCDVTPVPPTFTTAVCTGPGQNGTASYTIPSTTGVKYQVRFNTYGTWSDRTPDIYSIAANGYIEVRAVALDGFDLKNYSGPWKKQFSKPDCIIDVVPTKPVIEQTVCTGEGQSGGAGYTIPAVEGVKYQRWNGSNWVDLSPTFHPATPGNSVWIRAVELPGHELKGDDDDYRWELKFTPFDASKCVVPADATKTPPVCSAPGEFTPGSYTVPSDTGIRYEKKDGDDWVEITADTYYVDTFPTTVELRAVAVDPYKLYGGPYTWTFEFLSPGDCLEEVEVVGDPLFENPECAEETTGITPGRYFIPTTANVIYEVSLNGGPAEPATLDTWVNANPGDHVLITAKAAAGYTLTGDDSWEHTFENPGECLDEVEVGAVAKVDQVCLVTDDSQQLRAGKFATVVRTAVSLVSGYITIPNTPHVSYFIEPDMVTPVGPGNVDVEPGVYTVHAVAHEGYKLGADYDGPWVLEVLDALPCVDLSTDPAVTPLVTFEQTTCSVAGSYTLAVDPAEESAGIIWTVSGGLPNTVGKHSVNTPGLVTVIATTAEGYGFGDGLEGEFREFSFEFTGLPEDCLPTLALTGGNAGVTTGVLGLASLLMLGGVVMLVRGRREQFTAE